VPNSNALAAISAKHQLGESNWQPLSHPGIVNQVYTTNSFVLRIPHRADFALEDTFTERHILPLVQSQVRTPALFVFDSDRDILPVPFSIFSRIPADPLHRAKKVNRQKIAEAIHQVHSLAIQPHPDLDEHPVPELDEYFEVTKKFPDPEQHWIATWLHQLSPINELPYSELFIHGDLHEHNLLIDDNQNPWLIDWGDAGHGDPAVDFAILPTEHFIPILAEYQKLASPDQTLTARVALNQFLHHLRMAESARDQNLPDPINPLRNLFKLWQSLPDWQRFNPTKP
jgi:aminoglycoside phosphotransferase (APT) family kinase protein